MDVIILAIVSLMILAVAIAWIEVEERRHRKAARRDSVREG